MQINNFCIVFIVLKKSLWHVPILGSESMKVNETLFLFLRSSGSNGRFRLDITVMTFRKVAKGGIRKAQSRREKGRPHPGDAM